MPKKRKSARRASASKPKSEKPVFASPFKDLKKILASRIDLARPEPPKQVTHAKLAQPSEPAPNDDELLREAFAGVRRLGSSGAGRQAIQPPMNRTVVSEDAEVLAQLSDLVSGQGQFELTETEEYVEGARVGLDPRLVSRLRRGEFSSQAHIDLHGMTQVDAKDALTQFILDSARKGRRAVLVVHGRGLRSPGGKPVLKHAVAQWLSHGSIGGYVLAFTSARPQDGGTGAVSVLLRRERQRARFDVLQGTKRRE